MGWRRASVEIHGDSQLGKPDGSGAPGVGRSQAGQGKGSLGLA